MTARPVSKKERKRSIPSDEKFVVETEAGTLTLPNFAKCLNGAELRKNRGMDPLETLFYVIERDYEDDDLESADKVLESMGPVELGEMVVDWQEHARTTMGESSAS